MADQLTQEERRQAWWILAMNTIAFTICFAAWMMNGVLVTFFIDNGLFDWNPSEMGWLIGIPVLTGAIFRLPLGVATDKWGGRPVYGLLLVFAAIPMFLVSYCNSYWEFFAAGLGFGFCGTSFAIGIAFSSLWFPKHQQGTALGIFGAGNAGAALTSLGAPTMLDWLTEGGEKLEGWRHLPKFYAALLLVTGVVFFLTTKNRLPVGSATKSMSQRLAPLKNIRVWRFGLYYFFVFGGFVALAQWLVPYYVNAYGTTVALAGALAACNSFPSGVIRAAGGWMSDKWGARIVMYWVFGSSLICCLLLIVPQMDIHSPGSGIMARASGTVISATDNEVVVESAAGKQQTYKLKTKQGELVSDEKRAKGVLVLPRSMSWQESAVDVGDTVKKKELVARGVTHIFFQANIWVFTVLSLIIGAVMGIGKAAVYKHIPDYFPDDIGVVGGIVGVLGGLGGFICPVIFGYMLQATGLWTSCWIFFAVLIGICLFWMHIVIQRMLSKEAPELTNRI
ncbi:MAG: NarK/NasA family nitrate transporter [Planctomycetaceae bacterium]|jgi:MFS transporter, NNP family, nitrate/nitrite transporter|nr:NarK/NasA family nitrate transporter [Planctomycetaceae bacterium]MBT6156306.1 NarK/NasA family nitrate transporter [Planctomycetaceae bacterium]MBT6483493.1 NarK/NasA family nitrate transporter [Planctomycetaceae bacterium]MBT6494696.1 NarK/NasA family nitrate transporter [Planctomycetaceae bacterium]